MDPKHAEPHGVVMRAENSNGLPRGGFAFKAEMRSLDDYPDIAAPRILWGEYLDEPPRDILGRLEGGKTETALRKTAVFLREALQGGPQMAGEAIARGAVAGFSRARPETSAQDPGRHVRKAELRDRLDMGTARTGAVKGYSKGSARDSANKLTASPASRERTPTSGDEEDEEDEYCLPPRRGCAPSNSLTRQWPRKERTW